MPPSVRSCASDTACKSACSRPMLPQRVMVAVQRCSALVTSCDAVHAERGLLGGAKSYSNRATVETIVKHVYGGGIVPCMLLRCIQAIVSHSKTSCAKPGGTVSIREQLCWHVAHCCVKTVHCCTLCIATACDATFMMAWPEFSTIIPPSTLQRLSALHSIPPRCLSGRPAEGPGAW